MELNTSQPHHAQIISKPSRNPILYIGIGVILIALTALGLLVWQKNQEISSVLSQLSDAEQRVQDSVSFNAKNSGPVAEDTRMSQKSEQDQKTAAQLVASEYACSVKDFVCNKSESNVTEFQKVTDQTAGFAKVDLVTADGANKLTVWLKYRAGGSQWLVFYEGEAMPSAEIIKQFDIPTDFLAVN